MNRIGQQLVYFVNEPETRRNISTLLKFFGFLLAIIFAFSGIFHLIMGTMEEQEHSWLTGFYWTLTVMTTLGFGDITFHSDIGEYSLLRHRIRPQCRSPYGRRRRVRNFRERRQPRDLRVYTRI